jgi:hypothetical protein
VMWCAARATDYLRANLTSRTTMRFRWSDAGWCWSFVYSADDDADGCRCAGCE